MPVWYSKPRFSTGSTVTLSPGIAAREPVEHRAEPVALGPRPLRQIEPVEGGARRAGGAGRGDEARQQPSRLAGEAGDRRRVLAVERGAQTRRPLAGDAKGFGDRRHQGRQGEVDREIGHPDFGERLARHRDHLDIGFRPAGPDQLGAGLPGLPLGPHLRPFDPEHLAGIAEAQRPRPVRQPGRGDPGDLRGHVGAHPDHAVRDRVHRAKGVARHRGAGSRQQRLLEFDERRLHPLVAVRRQHPHQPPRHRGLDLGLGRQQIVEPGRQQRGVRRVIHRWKCSRASADVLSGWDRRCRPLCTTPTSRTGGKRRAAHDRCATAGRISQRAAGYSRLAHTCG